MRIGIGLWCLQSTATVPRPFTALYQELLEDARLAESVGIDSLWLSEHHHALKSCRLADEFLAARRMQQILRALRREGLDQSERGHLGFDGCLGEAARLGRVDDGAVLRLLLRFLRSVKG